ncbi:MAG: dihydrofolate reductase [Candidatus Gracilibacteria bacterium]|nr:dihydrofolate reductase [Candidatus Gracilibacteria bacterium]
MEINLIAAMTHDKVIGKNNSLPWDIPEDLDFFRKTTAGACVIMGRKTFESIGHPLPNRKNIVLSRNKNQKISGVEILNSKQKILNYLKNNNIKEKIFVIGGTEIYKLFLDNTDYIYLNLIHHNYPGDTFFPEFEDDFIEINREKGEEFDKILYKRKN